MARGDRVIETMGDWNILTSTLRKKDFVPVITNNTGIRYLEIENAIGGKRIAVFDTKEDIMDFIEYKHLSPPTGYTIKINKGHTVDIEDFADNVYRIQRKE